MSYNVERQRGPFGLFARRASQVLPGESRTLTLGSTKVCLKLEGDVFTITAKTGSVNVVFGSESEKLRPSAVATLDSSNPTITTGRRLVAIHPDDKSSEGAILWKQGTTNRDVLNTIAADKLGSAEEILDQIQ